MALISVALNMFANLINALLVQHTPGFEAVPIGALVLFWCTRPRIAWVATALMKVEEKKSMYFSLGASSLLAEIVLQIVGSPYLGMTVNFARKKGYYRAGKLKGIPHGWDALIMYAGALLWLVSVGAFLVYHLGLVLGVWDLVRRGLKTSWGGIVKVWRPVQAAGGRGWDSFVRFLQEFGVLCRKAWNLIVRCFCFWRTPPQQEEEAQPTSAEEAQQHSNQKGEEEATTIIEVREVLSTDDILATMGLNKKKLKAITFTPAFMLLPFLGQWLFWAGFVRLARDL